MSAILGIVGEGGSLPSDPVARTMLRSMRGRGGDRAEIFRGDGVLLAVARHEWELATGYAGPVFVARDGELAVAADASLYYRDDLRHALAARRVSPAGDTPGHLIMAAYRAWGEECADRLEGDYAFVLWDGANRRLVCSRDFTGRRTLFHANIGTDFVVASTLGALLGHPRCEPELNLPVVAAAAASFIGSTGETAYRGLSTLEAGHSVIKDRGRVPRITRHWNPPRFEQRGSSFEDGAAELRSVLTRATVERLASDSPTSVWLSGGWDSTAVYAVGQQFLKERGGEPLRAISISYPPGDPGREDELIAAVVEHWQGPVRWIDSEKVPLLDASSPGAAERRAAERDQPVGHIYEMWNRALIEGSSSGGARVAFDGLGGDSLFQTSPVFFADLLWSGRWPAFAREWRGMRMGGGIRSMFRWGVLPALPTSMVRAMARRAGKPAAGHLDRQLPAWFNARFAAEHHLAERGLATPHWRPGESSSAREARWYLTTPWVPAMVSLTTSAAVECGVEVRSPLYDRRVVALAATRPRWEKASMGQTKQLLRQAMRGLLPPHVLAPRTRRTGMTNGYLLRWMQRQLPPLVADVRRHSVLAELGIIDPAALSRAAEEFLRSGNSGAGAGILFTLNAEFWLRPRTAGAVAGAGERQLQEEALAPMS